MGDRGSDEAEDLPFRLLAQHLPTLCWISDEAGSISWVNDAWVAYTGLDADGVRKHGLEALHDPAVYPSVVKQWAEVRASGAAAEVTFPLKRHDGAYRQFLTRVVPLRDRDGRIYRWFGTNTDVTEQSETQAKLRSSEEQLREIFDVAADGIFIVEGAQLLDVNPAACALSGYTRAELLQIPLTELLQPTDAERLPTAQQQAAVRGEWRIRRKDGRWLDLEVSTRQLSDGRRLGVARDISERKRDEQARLDTLQQQVGQEAARAEVAERTMRRFWDASRDLFAIIPSTAGVPVMFNEDSWQATLGYSPKEITAQRLVELIHPEDLQATRSLAEQLGRGEPVFGFENRYRHADGRWVWLSWSLVRDGDLNFAIARDVTEEKLRAQHAERAQRLEALGKLTGGVAHDFNNMLTAILGALDLMQRKPDDRVLRERLMTAALSAVRRGERLNKQLLSFARREPLGGKANAPRLLLEMRPLLESALSDTVVLNYELSPQVTGCAIDTAQLEAAVLNLVVNARDAMPDGGIVTVRTRAATPAELARYGLAGEFAVLEVMDTGAGMPAEVLTHAFEPFFTTKGVGQGSGLGLAQVYGAARQAGGVATIESDVGCGAVVRMFLRTAEIEADAEPAAPAHGARPERVLLVEDDVLVGVVTESLLLDAGYEVIRAGDAVEALTALRRGEFDILLTDVRMPGAMNGAQLAREAVRRQPQLKVLLCSGWTAESLGNDVAACPWPLLPKPFDERQLRQALSELKLPAATERAQ